MSDPDSAHGPRPDINVTYDADDGWVVDISGADADLEVKMGRDDGAFVVALFDSTGPSFEQTNSPAYIAAWREDTDE